MELKSIVATNLTELRKKNGLTQMELADKLHYSDKAISKWERGESVPELETLVAIANLFGVTVDMILQEDGVKEYKKPKPQRNIEINRIIIETSASVIVWILASVIFSYGYIFINPRVYMWQAFIWAVPLTFLVLIVFNHRWHKNKVIGTIYGSLFLWAFITATYVSTMQYSTWIFFLVGIPVQILIVLLHCLKK